MISATRDDDLDIEYDKENDLLKLRMDNFNTISGIEDIPSTVRSSNLQFIILVSTSYA